MLHNLQERTELMTTLRDLELDPAASPTWRNRHVPEQQVAAELELAWWRSALESLLEADRALLGANTGMLDRLEADFRLVDEAHAAGSAQLLAWQLAENWKLGLVDWPDEAAALKRLLRHEHVTARLLHDAAPHLSRAVAPVWIASPYEVHSIADTVPFDTVVLVDAGATTLAENVGAIRRGKQTVAFGDPVTQTPSEFDIAVDARQVGRRADRREPEQPVDSCTPNRALARLVDAAADAVAHPQLPRRRRRPRRARQPPLLRRTHRVAARGPAASSATAASRSTTSRAARPCPTPSPAPSRASTPRSTASSRSCSSTPARARSESLMVHHRSAEARGAGAAGRAHRASRGHKDLTEFVVGDRGEPFMVATLEQSVAQSRDHVIFSIGYGRTPHGRVLSDFGPLGQPGRRAPARRRA